jgi:simple sugar transport system permease protein
MKLDIKPKLPKQLPVLILCLLAASLLMTAFSSTPLDALHAFFPGVISNPLYLGEMLNMVVLLSLTGLAIVIAFAAGSFNLGGEGQAYLGALCAVLCARALPDLPSCLGIPLLLLSGVAGGAALAFLSGVLKAKWRVDELISTFLLSAGVSQVINYLIAGPLSDPDSYLLTTTPLPEAYRLPSVLPPSPLNPGLIFPIIILPLAWYIMNHTRRGYELRMTGHSNSFARYGGLNTGLYETIPLSISGGLHGLAGALVLTGTYFAGIQGLTFGLGWNGMAVALIASRSVPGLIPAALFFSWISQGARLAVLRSGLSLELGAIIQGVLFLLITSRRLRFTRKKS